MNYNKQNIMVSSTLAAIVNGQMQDYVTLAYCTSGECTMTYNGDRLKIDKGNCLLVPPASDIVDIVPSEDFKAKVLFIHKDYITYCTPRTHYGIIGGLTLIHQPIFHLIPWEQEMCEKDIDNIRTRMGHQHLYYYAESIATAIQTLLIDLLEFHDRIYGHYEVSEQTESLMFRFIKLLESGEYKKHRDVAWYASLLNVTPKYLSEICRRSTRQSVFP